MSYFSKSQGVKKLVKSIKVLPANIKSMNPMQKYPHIIELLDCILNMFVFMFLCLISFSISLGTCSTPNNERIMLRFGEKEIAKENFYASKSPIKIWHINNHNIIISKLVKTKINSKYLIGIKSDKAIRLLVLIILKMSGYVKTIIVKEEDKGKSNKLMSLHIDDKKLLEHYKAIWTKIENLKNIELNALPVYDDRYI